MLSFHSAFTDAPITLYKFRLSKTFQTPPISWDLRLLFKVRGAVVPASTTSTLRGYDQYLVESLQSTYSTAFLYLLKIQPKSSQVIPWVIHSSRLMA
jgi:hypothetical protein